jgi:hypothetical protein
MEHHILLSFAKIITIITIFDLHMFHGKFDTFALVVNYKNKKWKPGHITMGIFEVHEIIWATMALQLKDFLVRYNLLDKVIAYVKDEGTIVNTFSITLTNIMFWANAFYNVNKKIVTILHFQHLCNFNIDHVDVWKTFSN